MIEVAKIMETYSQAFHGPNALNKTTFIFTKDTGIILEDIRLRQVNCNACKSLQKMCSSCCKIKNVPESAIMCRVRTRTFIRRRCINERIIELNNQKKMPEK